MPFDGNGNYNPLAPPDFPAVAGNTIIADEYNNQINDMATALSAVFPKDGQAAATGHWNIGNFRLTNVGAATTAGDALPLNSTGGATFSMLGARIIGDFTNATLASRLCFQTSTANSTTGLVAVPSGTGTSAAITVANAADPDNAALGILSVATSSLNVEASKAGTGSFLPIRLRTSNTDRVEVDTSGGVGIEVSSPSTYGKFVSATPSGLGGKVAVRNSEGAGGGAQIAGWYNSVRTHYVDFYLDDGTGGSEDSHIEFGTVIAGTLATRASLTNAGSTVTWQVTDGLPAPIRTSLSTSVAPGGAVVVSATYAEGDASLTINAEDTLTLAVGADTAVLNSSGLTVNSAISSTGGSNISTDGGYTCQGDQVVGARELTGVANATGAIARALTNASSQSDHNDMLRKVVNVLYAHGLMGT